jgi:2-oxoglutarate ferredoxin oxidoreductase subunit delta
MAKGRVVIDEGRCKGCALCITACPQAVLVISTDRFNARGYRPVELVDPEGKCTGCALCAVVCPDVCIGVLRFAGARPVPA